MELSEQFNQAVAASKELTRRPDNEELLELYALYKQATEGNVTDERPGGFDFKAIAKYDAWESKKGQGKEDAMKAYIDLVKELQQNYG